MSTSTTIALLLGAALATQNTPPELSRKQLVIEPTLPEVLRKTVSRASDAELDPKRGTGNAVQILRDEKRKYDGRQVIAMALDLRVAAAVIRTRFLHNQKVGEPARWQQAVSTFSKLELAEPGLATWIDRMLAKNPTAKGKLLGKPGARPIKVAVLTRGGGMNKGAIHERLRLRFGDAGFDIERVPVAKADFLFKLASDEVREGDDGTVVRVTLDVEQMHDGKTEWRKSFYRTSRAAKLRDAIDANVDWLIRVGGRDVVFRGFVEAGLEATEMKAPSGGHDHRGHGPKVTLPNKGKTQPKPPSRK